MTPEERKTAIEAETIFMHHIPHLILDCEPPDKRVRIWICFRDRERWPCAAIQHARELTKDLANEVD